MELIDLFRVCTLLTMFNAQISYGQEVDSSGGLHNIYADRYDRPVEYNGSPYRDGVHEANKFIDTFHDPRCINVVPHLEEVPLRERVTTKYGVVVGRQIYLCDGPWVEKRNRPGFGGRPTHRVVNVFLGIPYARPPNEDHLRFKPPEEPIRSGEIVADTYKPACLQHGKFYGPDTGVRTVDEDCLYLNIFAPREKIAQKYPVMIYIHGGEWDHGSGNTFPGHMLAASQRVIVVTFNYRLGHLGFLATGDGVSPGNYGMLDQVMAIKWVYTNIESFGGDQNNIVLFGVGTGAASAGLHALSPLSKHMIRRVIAQSGSAVADWSVIKDPQHMINTTQILKELIGCPVQSSLKLLACLGSRKEADVRMLKIKPRIGWLAWGPVVDTNRIVGKPFLPFLPEDILSSQNVRFKPDFAYLTGVTRDEASAYLMDDIELTRRNYRINEDMFYQKIGEFMQMYNYTINRKAIFDALTFMYEPWSDPTNETLLRQGYINMLSDRYFVAPTDKMVKLLLKNRIPTYMYLLNYTIKGLLRPHWQGVPHDTEYFLITGAPFMHSNFYPKNLKLATASWQDSDRDMSEFFMTSWANFARDGIPTPTKLFNTIFWEPMAPKSLRYLNLNGTNVTVSMELDYHQKESQFWNSYLPSLINREPPTLAPSLEPWIEERSVYRAALWGAISGAIIMILLTLMFCILYCRKRRNPKRAESEEVIMNTNTNHRN